MLAGQPQVDAPPDLFLGRVGESGLDVGEGVAGGLEEPGYRVRLVAPDQRGGFLKAELDGVRERMRTLGFSCDEVAAEVSRRYQVRPRQAYWLARGWTQDEAAARFNELAASQGTDPDGRASMTGSQLCEVGQWPNSDRKPSVYVLCLLAGVYETDVLCLLDLADHESLPQHDRLVLTRRLPAQTSCGSGPWRWRRRAAFRYGSWPAGCRAMPRTCRRWSTAGRGRPREWRPGWIICWTRAGNWSRSRMRWHRATALSWGRTRPAHPANCRPRLVGGMSLTLPYVPARLVIEVSGPAGAVGLAEDGSGTGAAPGRLALVRGGTRQADGSEAG